MPTYDYRCRDCGHTVEIIHSILDDGPEACERCRGRVDRVLHPTGVIFRGSGFYVTDSRTKEGSESGASGDGGSGSGADATSKPETSGGAAGGSGPE